MRSSLIRPHAQAARATALAVGLMASGGAGAQNAMTGVPNAMQGFSQNRDQPVRIEADVFELRDKRKQATFSGHVKVVQGDTIMTSSTLVALYDSLPSSTPAAKAKSSPMRSATPGPGGSSSIRRLRAQGNVVVTQKDQVVSGDTAVFDTDTNQIAMRGGVVLSQCQNVLRGDRLLVDMTTGFSRVESDSGRVQALLPRNSAGCGMPPGGPESHLPRRAPNKPK